MELKDTLFFIKQFLREEVLTAIESFGIPEAQPKVLELKERANSEQKSVARPSTTFDGLLMVTEDKVNGVAITKYHARRNNWTNEKQIPTKRQEGAAVIALNTKLIFVGGQDENCVAVNTVNTKISSIINNMHDLRDIAISPSGF